MVAVVAPRYVDQPVHRPATPYIALYRAPPARPGARRRPSAQVYRRRRVVALMALVVVIVGAWTVTRRFVAADTGTGLTVTSPMAARVWVVHTGDALWSIVMRSGATGDIRPLVDELSAEVHGRPLQVGERITLP